MIKLSVVPKEKVFRKMSGGVNLNKFIKFFDKVSWKTILGIFLGVFFLRNLLMPLIADDISYAFIWDGEHGGNLLMNIGERQRVENFADILVSQWSHYFYWGGRTIAHLFVQSMVFIGKPLFDVLNVAMFAALTWLLFKIGTGLNLRDMNKKYLLWILSGLWFCTPAFALTTLWLTGSCNYLWMCTLEVLFLLPFAMKFRQKNFWAKEKTWQVVLMSVLGLVAGWSIEPGAAVTLCLTFGFLLYFRKERDLQAWMKAGFLFLVIGAAILILAPGNISRMELVEIHEPDPFMPPEYLYSFEMFSYNFLAGFLPVLLREAILFLPIIYLFVSGKATDIKAKIFVLMFSVASVLTLCIMMLSPEFPERAGFPSTVFLIIASLAALKEILPQVTKALRPSVIKLCSGILAAAWFVTVFGCLYVDYECYSQTEERLDYIVAHKDDDLILVRAIKIPKWSEDILGSRTWDEYVMFWGADLGTCFEENRNVMLSQYLGLKPRSLVRFATGDRRQDLAELIFDYKWQHVISTDYPVVWGYVTDEDRAEFEKLKETY